MLLAVDIGNSSIKFGVFDGETLTTKFSIPTNRNYSPSEIAECIGDRLDRHIEAAIVCSVVPELDAAIADYSSHYLHVEPRFVRNTDDFGLIFNFPVDSTGTDRLINSFAAANKYGVPCVVVSFGTATTIDVVNGQREYLGGLIAPGINVNAQALTHAASKLPAVELIKPEYVIAQSTETAIQSGLVYGQIAMVEGLLKRVIAELGNDPKIIATGGFAELISADIDPIDIVDKELTFDGLRMFYRE